MACLRDRYREGLLLGAAAVVKKVTAILDARSHLLVTGLIDVKNIFSKTANPLDAGKVAMIVSPPNNKEEN